MPENGADAVYAQALRRLVRKPLTESELRGQLARAGHPAAAIDATLERLRQEHQIDDLALARHYIVTRAERLGHGPQRLLAELERRGVDRQVAQSAWRAAAAEELPAVQDLLHEQVRRQLRSRGGRLDARAYPRVYNALLRAGFEGPAVIEALAPHRSADDSGDDPDLADGMQDDIS